MKVAIIGGTGKMGRWFAALLKNEGNEVIITGRNRGRLQKAKEELGVETTTNPAIAVEQAETVLISVPIDSFESVAKELQPHLTSDHKVIDVTSVKTMPVKIMHKYLRVASILGAHPVFGPGARGLHNQNVVLTPTDETETALAWKIRQYLEERGAVVSIMTPQEHDEMIAVILGLAHFIAIVSADTLLNFKRLKEMAAIAGPTYKVLLTLAESVLTEDPDLYASIQMNLPGMGKIERDFLKSTQTWADIINNRDKQHFIERMDSLKKKMHRANPDFGKSYETMYKLLEK